MGAHGLGSANQRHLRFESEDDDGKKQKPLWAMRVGRGGSSRVEASTRLSGASKASPGLLPLSSPISV